MVKLTSSTLVETLVSTVIIVLIFMVSSLLLNQLTKQHFALNKTNLSTQLKMAKYECLVKNLQAPYREEDERYILIISEENSGVSNYKEINIEIYDKVKELSLSETLPLN